MLSHRSIVAAVNGFNERKEIAVFVGPDDPEQVALMMGKGRWASQELEQVWGPLQVLRHVLQEVLKVAQRARSRDVWPSCRGGEQYHPHDSRQVQGPRCGQECMVKLLRQGHTFKVLRNISATAVFMITASSHISVCCNCV